MEIDLSTNIFFMAGIFQHFEDSAGIRLIQRPFIDLV